MLLFWVAAVFFFLAPIAGIYLSLWLISKRMSALPLVLYGALAVVCVLAFLAPLPTHGALSSASRVVDTSLLVLWLLAAFTLRRNVMRYYSDREGVPFSLNAALTALFGPWYIGGHLRAEYPSSGAGQTGSGVLKLVI